MSDDPNFDAYEHSGRGYVATEGELQKRFATYEVRDDNPERTAKEKEHILRIEAEKEKYMREHGHDIVPPKKEGLLSRILPGNKHGEKDDRYDHDSAQGRGHEHEHGNEHHQGVAETHLHGDRGDGVGEERRERDRAIDEENARRDAAVGGTGSVFNPADRGLPTDGQGHIVIHKTSSHPDDPVLVVADKK